MPKTNKQRGGARPGAGRPLKYDAPMEQRPVPLAAQHLEAIENWVDDFGLEGEDAKLPAVIREMIEKADAWRRGRVSKRRR